MKRRVIGLACFFMGLGMFIVIFIPYWGFLLSFLLMAAGFWNLFC